MKIVFLTGLAKQRALRKLIAAGRDVVAVVVPEGDVRGARFEQVARLAKCNDIQVIQSKAKELKDAVEGLDCDILCSCGFPYLIPAEVLKMAAYPINSHLGLLPQYRGRYMQHVIINGERESGVTCHFMTEQFDAGNIIGQVRVPLTPFDTTRSMLRKCETVEPELLLSCIDQIETGDYVRTPQDESQAAVYIKKRTPADSQIDPSKSLSELYNFIRACDPVEYPAFFFVDGKKVCIELWRENKPQSEVDMI